MTGSYRNVDDKILQGIDRLRERDGACTAGTLASHLRMSRDAIRHRCEALRAAGKVVWSAAPGSLRRVVDERQHRMMLLLANEVLDRTNSDDEVGRWCMQKLLLVHDLVGLRYMTVPPSPPQETETVTTAAPELTAEPRCEACDRTFTSAFALAGHERSKAHAATIALAATG